jgi:hypothetical protein
VDDILLIGNDILIMEAIKSSLKKSLSIRLIGLSQNAYIDKILNRFNM